MNNREAAYRMMVVTRGNHLLAHPEQPPLTQRMFLHALEDANLVVKEKFARSAKCFARESLVRRVYDALGVIRGTHEARRIF